MAESNPLGEHQGPSFRLYSKLPHQSQGNTLSSLHTTQQPQGQFSQSHHAFTQPNRPANGGNNAYQAPPIAFVHHNTPAPAQQQATPNARTPRRPRACDNCRSLKVRCEADPGIFDCKRCIKAGRICRMIEPSQKRLKKSHHTTTDWQQGIQAITRTVAPFVPGPSNAYAEPASYADEEVNASSHRAQPKSTSYVDPNLTANATRVAPEGVLQSHPYYPRTSPYHYRYVDVVERYFPKAADAYGLFYYFLRNMAPQMPIVNVSHTVNSELFRATNATLFLAILSVAAPGHMQAQLNTEVLRILGDRIIVHNEESLEHIQALQIIMSWYWPEGGKDARWNQYCSMACAMLTSLGMTAPSEDGQHWSSWSAKYPDKSVEGARAYVGCFIFDKIVAKESRGSSITRIFTPNFVANVIAVLESSHSPLDPFLAQWARLHHLMPHAVPREPMATITNSSKDDSILSLQASISSYQTLIDKWQAQYSPNWVPKSLTLGFYTSSLCIHQPITQFRAMLARWHVRDEDKKKDEFATRAALFHDCVSIFHRVLGSFLEFRKEEVCALPIFELACVMHALFLLIMIERAFTLTGNKKPKHFPVESLRSMSYLDRVVSFLRESTNTPGPCRSVQGFLVLLSILQGWMHQESQGVCDFPRPIAPEKANQISQAPEAGTASTGLTPLELLSQAAMETPRSKDEPLAAGGSRLGHMANRASMSQIKVANSESNPLELRSSIGTALKLVLAEGDIDLAYFEGFVKYVEVASRGMEKM